MDMAYNIFNIIKVNNFNLFYPTLYVGYVSNKEMKSYVLLKM